MIMSRASHYGAQVLYGPMIHIFGPYTKSTSVVWPHDSYFWTLEKAHLEKREDCLSFPI